MNNGFLIFCLVLITFVLADNLIKGCKKDEYENQHDRLLEQVAMLRQDSIENARYQDSARSVIDSITSLKQKRKIIYEKDIDTIYFMDGSLLDSLLARAYDSLYIHRFSHLIKKADSDGSPENNGIK